MWETINQSILAFEIVLALVGVLFVYGRKNATKTFIYMCVAYVLNFTIYSLPAIYEKYALSEPRSVFFYLLDIIPSAAKMLFGDTSTGLVEDYATEFPIYVYVYAIGFVISVAATSYAAISTFGRRALNVFKVAAALNSSACDIVAGYSAEALGYAKQYKKTVVAIPAGSEKSLANSLVNDGYTVMRVKLSKEFFCSKYFNPKTKYNVIFPNDGDGYSDVINNVVSYFNTCKPVKDVHFYIEVGEKAVDIAKKQIDTVCSDYRERITLFSRNELIARTFADENPITEYMPKDFFCEDSSVKGKVNFKVFFIDFCDLSRELYRQLAINNQLAEFRDGEYRAKGPCFFVYDESADDRVWEINGLSDTMKALAENSEEYFPLPDMPYSVEHIDASAYEFDRIKEISARVDSENSFSYIIIDTGDEYRNVEIAERFGLLLDKCDNYRIFAYSNSTLPRYKGITYYGNTRSFFTHDVIVNDSLADLARSVNKFYSGSDNWSTLSYFDMYSNLSLASNLRLKLNLLGLDYVKDGKGDGEDTVRRICESYLDSGIPYADCLCRSKRSAMLAQEHFRWNAYHLLSGYLPMKKRRITVDLDESSGKVKKVIKNNALKKHSCLTTFTGLDHLSQYLAGKANAACGSERYTAEDFDYYKYDGLLLEALPDFLKENKYSVTEK